MRAPAISSTTRDEGLARDAGQVEFDSALRAPGNPGLVYDLRTGEDSAKFYQDAARFADDLLTETELRAAEALSGYAQFVHDELREPERSRGEYALELLALGMALARYAGAAEHTQEWAVKAARTLFRLRRTAAWVKPLADLARAALTRTFLMPHIGRKASASVQSPLGLPRLIEWLEAAGEFEQEAARLRNWTRYIPTQRPNEAHRLVVQALGLFAWFEREAEIALGAYTHGVKEFLAHEYVRRGCREDQLFCGRPAVEYHLGMVTAEIMNRGLREEFECRSKKVVLVPACLRGAKAADCGARIDGTDIVCTACDPECAVNRITRRMRELSVQVYVIPHATGFSRWLKRWQREPDTGVVAVACLLNILPGGYEMRARGIASQCALLDYPGCAKHWREEAIPTAVNEPRLVQIAAATSARLCSRL